METTPDGWSLYIRVYKLRSAPPVVATVRPMGARARTRLSPPLENKNPAGWLPPGTCLSTPGSTSWHFDLDRHDHIIKQCARCRLFGYTIYYNIIVYTTYSHQFIIWKEFFFFFVFFPNFGFFIVVIYRLVADKSIILLLILLFCILTHDC